MNPTQKNYPIFEANQVLTQGNLNDAFNYLDDQQRMTRANLIGIGIVCGLEVQLNGTTIHLSKGCGITSEGYLIVEPESLDFVSYRLFVKPSDYEPFNNLKNNVYEIFTREVSDTTPLGTGELDLQKHAVVLFLEKTEADLRNCSPNNCSDKGKEITPTIRHLLVKHEDFNPDNNIKKLDAAIRFSNKKSLLSMRLDLDDLRLPRYDVPNSNPADANQILRAFQVAIKPTMIRNDDLVTKTHNALNRAYEVYKPILQTHYQKIHSTILYRSLVF